MNQRGQILIPSLAAIIAMVLISMGYIRWASRSLWQMRMDSAADAAALSAARAQAEMLNTISVSNVGINPFIQKVNTPVLRDAVGIIQEGVLPAYYAWNDLLRAQVSGFRAFPAGVGMRVARLNGAQGRSLYFPAPMDPYLQAQAIHAGIVLSHPPWGAYRHLEQAYYARAWEPGKTRAQPPHKTTWLVRRGSVRSLASARLWLDIQKNSRIHNGGFPRPHEQWLRGAFIQGFYPQFNARLLAEPAISLERFLAVQARGRTS